MKKVLVTGDEGVGPSLAKVLKKERIKELQELVDAAADFAVATQEAVDSLHRELHEAKQQNIQAQAALSLLVEELINLVESV